MCSFSFISRASGRSSLSGFYPPHYIPVPADAGTIHQSRKEPQQVRNIPEGKPPTTPHGPGKKKQYPDAFSSQQQENFTGSQQVAATIKSRRQNTGGAADHLQSIAFIAVNAMECSSTGEG
jgi:hypothetical protein